MLKLFSVAKHKNTTRSHQTSATTNQKLSKSLSEGMPVAEHVISTLTLEEITATFRVQDPGDSYFSLQVFGLSEQCNHSYSTAAAHHNRGSRS